MVILKFLRCLCVFSFKGDVQKVYRIFSVSQTGHDDGGGMRLNHSEVVWLLLNRSGNDWVMIG